MSSISMKDVDIDGEGEIKSTLSSPNVYASEPYVNEKGFKYQLLFIILFVLLGIMSRRISEVESANKDGGYLGSNGDNNNLNDIEKRLNNLTTHVSNQMGSVMETMEGLQSDLQDLAARIDNRQNNQTYDIPIDGKTSLELLMEAGVQNASKYVTEFGFIVVQERTSASMTFYLTLSNYTEGFGDSQNFWIGLDVMNKLTSRYTWILRIEARVSGTGLFAIGEYHNFRVASRDQNYRFNIDYEISSAFGSDLLRMNARPFSTSSTCAGSSRYRSGWWYPTDCGGFMLNAPMLGQSYAHSTYQARVTSSTYVTSTKMIIRRA
ncbi:uncharacterized protein LOC142338419 isoform X2 [Convolutriloba macropyga]|uniref:uncharacterized protein LOC142338419 isoform X2 n=1 Tax=Convolutriloba macropyga TaxID=536237 RepID=UPI003F51C8BB